MIASYHSSGAMKCQISPTQQMVSNHVCCLISYSSFINGVESPKGYVFTWDIYLSLPLISGLTESYPLIPALLFRGPTFNAFTTLLTSLRFEIALFLLFLSMWSISCLGHSPYTYSRKSMCKLSYAININCVISIRNCASNFPNSTSGA